jgi:GTP pyrophosphokinase
MTRLDKIIEQITSYHPTADLDVLHKAYIFSGKVHQGQYRLSGDAYLSHPLEVAEILARLQLDMPTIVTGLLHDTIEDTLTTHAEISSLFGEEIADLVDGVTKIGKITFKTSEQRQAESFRKMLLAMARDIRVILVKLADRLHNMRTLGSQDMSRRKLIAQETLDIYAPLANRMGISWIKSELENLSFCYLFPEVYAELSHKLEQQKKAHGKYVDAVEKQLLKLLAESGIEGKISGRSKHLYSVYQKMQRQGIPFEEVHDLVAFRILVDSVRDCYAALGMVHATWKPIPGRFKDYIAMPKANMYQSLHTTVMGPKGERMEVQIRTHDMHRIAEEGIAAHWKYKEGGAPVAVVGQSDKRFAWLRQMLEWQQDMKDSREFLSAVKVDLFPEEVYVFTPGGDVKELPRGATPIDFAYAVHTDIGHRCTGAKINGRLVPLKTALNNGDIVEVTTGVNQTPSKDWLKFVRTSRARNKIRNWVKTQEREKSIELGRDLLDKKLRKYDLSLKKVLVSDEFNQAGHELGFKHSDDVLAALGYGKVSIGQVLSRVVPKEKLKPEKEKPTAGLGKVLERIRKKPSSAIKIDGVDDIMVRFAKCCNPLQGDPVVGFITRGRGVTVHTSDCPYVQDSDPERRITVEWDKSKSGARSVKIRVFCENQKGMLAGITAAMTNTEANIISAKVQSTPDNKGVNNFEVDVQDLEHLNRVIKAIMKVKGVYRVERLRTP